MEIYNLGIDIGSTTVKVVLINEYKNIIYSKYERHNTLIRETLKGIISKLLNTYSKQSVRIVFSGSAGLGYSEQTGLAFVQEVVAASNAVKKMYPGVKAIVDIGGEDAKLVLFNAQLKPDIRMNGNCAGGTGAYIDEMANLLNVSIEELNALACHAKNIYPIASRCGVFAKTDVQNLLSRKIGKEEIAASIFDAVACQIINSLAKGDRIIPKLLFCGGPLTYISYLRECILKRLKMFEKDDYLLPNHSELFVAIGAALSSTFSAKPITVLDFFYRLEEVNARKKKDNRIEALFRNEKDLTAWRKSRKVMKIEEVAVTNEMECYLGIDSGSTTTKIVVINGQGKIVYKFYRNNQAKPLETVIEGLKLFADRLKRDKKTIKILGAASTGYGEELIKNALKLDFGIVETIAHFLAAKKLEPNVSFILDIGGQDIKAIYVQNSTINDIKINEACSSGCGSFIENFANRLGYTINEFSELALKSDSPYDLGSRCTVFMNSKVKQAIREGASISDLSSGLAFSVIKNCLYKVLHIGSEDRLGDHVLVQGGIFKNEAVFRAFEQLSGKNIITSDKPELMGAYGAALYALKKSDTKKSFDLLNIEKLNEVNRYSIKYFNCSGCTNNCKVTAYTFLNGQKCYSGNKCEKTVTNNSALNYRGENIFEHKRKILFADNIRSEQKQAIQIGIPRILNMYENYPFWETLFTACGIKVILSDESSQKIHKKGLGLVMSENICFPAKISHGHIINLMEKKVDRIFFPLVIYERKEHRESTNSFNCPVVTGYSEVLKNITGMDGSHKIPFDSPTVNFSNSGLLFKACLKYLSDLGIEKSKIRSAYQFALKRRDEVKKQIIKVNTEIYKNAIEKRQPVILVASHPYHLDTLIHHRVSQMLSDLGINVINEEVDMDGAHVGFSKYFAISQWEYINRILQAASWVGQQSYPVGLIHLNSFGCGPDSFVMDEIADIAKRDKTSYALIRIDEISSSGSLKLRLRSLVESLRLRKEEQTLREKDKKPHSFATFESSDKKKTILVPWFSDFYSPFVPILGKIAGYKVINLPQPNKTSITNGLSHANNEICFPATIVIGDIIKALKSNKYNVSEIAIGITQTGGQCRATNYLALIRRAMINEGYGHVPLISAAPTDSIYNRQPGFKINWKKLIRPVFLGLLFVDGIARMYYGTVSREKNKGQSKLLKEKYLSLAMNLIEKKRYKHFQPLLKEAVSDFNSVETISDEIQTIGVVGEIYVKYNSFSQFGVVDWLIENRVEVVIPPLIEFFMQSFVNQKTRINEDLEYNSGVGFIQKFLELGAEYYVGSFEKILSRFNYYRPVFSIQKEAKLASEIVSLANQYGEGWLIPAEIASFALQGISEVICMQPFGCIANHIVGKGVEKRIKDIYPDMNLLFLDFDCGSTKIHLLNRLQFLIQNKQHAI